MSWVAVAVAGGAVVGAVASSSAADNAADAQVEASGQASAAQLQAQRESIAFQREMADRARADQEPWRQAGIGALNRLAGTSDFTGSDLANDPGYQFGLNEGLKGVQHSAAAQGSLLSGATLKALNRYGQDYAGTKFNDAFNRDAANKNRLASLAGIGQTASNANSQNAFSLGANVGNGMMATGNALAQNALGVGNARAASGIASANAWSNGINNGVNALANRPAKPTTPSSGAGMYGNGGWGTGNGYGNEDLGSYL